MRADDLYATITDQLIADIEAGTGDWRMPWHTLATHAPSSVEGRRYRGVNALWLAMVADARGWSSGVWGTYKTWQRHGAQVRRGEHGTSVLLWKTIQGDSNESEDAAVVERGTRPTRRLVARTFTVFGAEQTDAADQASEPTEAPPVEHVTRIAHAEAYFDAIAATVRLGGDRACYRPASDTIELPDPARFDQPEHFWATAAHEHIHWTGHPSRLDRDLTGRFGSDAYAAEELVAELGAAMWSAEARLTTVTRADHAAYLAGWLRILRADPRHLLTIASRAQQALDHLTALAGRPPTATDT